MNQEQVMNKNDNRLFDDQNKQFVQNCSMLCANVDRFSRQTNDDSLPTVIHRMKLIAGTTNAIHLQNGLIDNTLSPFDIASELLRFGPVKPTDLVAGDFGKVLEEVKKLPEKLTMDPETQNAAKAYGVFMEMKGLVDGVKDVTKWEGKATFESDLKNMKLDFPVVLQLKDNIGNFKSQSSRIRQFFNDKNEEESLVYLKDIIATTDKCTSQTDELSQKIDSMVQLPSGQNVTSLYSEMKNLYEAVKLFSDHKTEIFVNNDWKPKIQLVIDTMTSIRVADVVGRLEVVNLMLANRKSEIKDLKLTPGFPNGLEEMLRFQFPDPWLKEFLDITTLAPLQFFVNKIKEKSDELRNVENLNELQNFLNALVFTGNPADLFKCFNAQLHSLTIDVKSMEPIQENILKLDEEMGKLRGVVEFLRDDRAKNIFEKAKNIASKATSSDKTLLTAVVKEYVEFAEELNLDTFFANFEAADKAVNTDNILGAVKTVSDQFPTLNTFQGTLTKFNGMFTCLKNISTVDATATQTIITSSQNFKVPDKIQSEMTKATTLFTSLQSMQNFSIVIQEMKKLETPESKELTLLGNSSTHSTVLSQATNGIVNLKEVLDEGKVLEEIIELSKNLAGFDGVKTMADELKAWKSGVKVPKDLPGYSKVFLNAAKVHGVADLKKIKESLAKNETKLIKALEELDAVGVDFSSYKNFLENSKNTLDALDTFFSRHETQKTQKPTRIPTIAYIIRGSLVAVIIVIGGTVTFLMCCFKKGYFAKKGEALEDSVVVDKTVDKTVEKPMDKENAETKAPEKPKLPVEGSGHCDFKKSVKQEIAKNAEEASKKMDALILQFSEKTLLRMFIRYIEGQFKHMCMIQSTEAGNCEHLQPERTRKLMGGYFQTLEKHVRKLQRLPNYYLQPASAVLLNVNFYQRCRHRNNYIQASWHVLPNNAVYIMAQTPIIGKTDDKFWYMIAQTGASVIIGIYGDDEFNALGGCEKDYGLYVPKTVGASLEHRGNGHPLTVTCTAMESDGQFVHRTIKLKYSNPNGPIERDAGVDIEIDKKKELLRDNFNPNEFELIVDHYEINGWSYHVPPKDTSAVLKALNVLKGKEKVVIHCADGTIRTIMLTCLEMCRLDFTKRFKSNEENALTAFEEVLKNVVQSRRLRRPDPTQEYQDTLLKFEEYGCHLMFVLVSIADYLKQGVNVKDDKKYGKGVLNHYKEFHNCYKAYRQLQKKIFLGTEEGKPVLELPAALRPKRVATPGSSTPAKPGPVVPAKVVPAALAARASAETAPETARDFQEPLGPSQAPTQAPTQEAPQGGHVAINMEQPPADN